MSRSTKQSSRLRAVFTAPVESFPCNPKYVRSIVGVSVIVVKGRAILLPFRAFTLNLRTRAMGLPS
jgi:hypothetical protein